MEGRQRRSFTDDYKRQAVDLVASRTNGAGMRSQQYSSSPQVFTAASNV
jgi:hypothetical protein